MQLERLEFLDLECRRSLVEAGWANEIDIYYLRDGSWRHHATDEPAPLEVAAELARGDSAETDFHSPGSVFACFRVAGFEHAVLRARFPSSPQKKTRDSFRTKLADTCRHAGNEFNVKHNPKTGLLAQDEFTSRLCAAIAGRAAGEVQGQSSELEARPLIGAVAIDIDHFKQVNEDFGHLYGDLVIKGVALRIDQAVRGYVKALNKNLQVEVAHFSGEEFWIALHGAASLEDVRGLATHVCSAISERTLPSDSELSLVAADPVYDDVTKPPEKDRRITISVGCAAYSGSSSSSPSTDASRLLQQADYALGKSKSTGRNRVTLFPEILDRLGRVLEYRQDLGVVVIDIGANVGVIRGQEFRVFHPDFAGSTPFNYSDGRTTKKLGTYPRMEQCTIYAFAVQKDIAFCKLSDAAKVLGLTITPGSVLEAIPLGAIGPVLEGDETPFMDSGSGLEILSATKLSLLLGSLRADKRGWAVVVLRIRDPQEILEKYGNVTINKALSLLMQGIKSHLPNVRSVAQLEPTTLSVLLDSFDQTEVERAAAALISEVEGKVVPRVRFAGGGCIAEPIPRNFDPSRHVPQREHPLELARYAASDEALGPDKKFEVFSDNTPASILNSWRDKDAQKGLSDYRTLKGFGFSGPVFENAAGLLAAEIGEHELALACYREAHRQKPNVQAYRSNMGISLFLLGKPEEALNEFESIGYDKMVELGHGLSCTIYARLLLLKYRQESTEQNKEQFISMAKLALVRNKNLDSPNRRKLEEELRVFDR